MLIFILMVVNCQASETQYFDDTTDAYTDYYTTEETSPVTDLGTAASSSELYYERPRSVKRMGPYILGTVAALLVLYIMYQFDKVSCSGHSSHIWPA